MSTEEEAPKDLSGSFFSLFFPLETSFNLKSNPGGKTSKIWINSELDSCQFPDFDIVLLLVKGMIFATFCESVVILK